MKIKEKFITDEKGRKVSVIISIKDYNELLDKVEELEDIKLFDKLKSEDDELIPFDQAVKEIEESRKK
jgi:hypothetical protein